MFLNKYVKAVNLPTNYKPVDIPSFTQCLIGRLKLHEWYMALPDIARVAQTTDPFQWHFTNNIPGMLGNSKYVHPCPTARNFSRSNKSTANNLGILYFL